MVRRSVLHVSGLIATTGLLLTGCSGGADTSEPDSLSAPLPSPTVAGEFKVTGLPTVEELQVSSALSDEEIAAGFVNILGEWGMAGVNKDMASQWPYGENEYLSLPEYSTKVATASAPTFTEASFGPYASNPEVRTYEQGRIEYNAALFQGFYETTGTASEEPLYVNLVMTALTALAQNDDGTTRYDVVIEQDANNDKNIVDQQLDGLRFEVNFTVDKSGPVAYLTQPLVFE